MLGFGVATEIPTRRMAASSPVTTASALTLYSLARIPQLSPACQSAMTRLKVAWRSAWEAAAALEARTNPISTSDRGRSEYGAT